MSAKLLWSIFLGINLCLLGFFITSYKPQIAGDVVEYFGMTVSLFHHGDVGLTSEDQKEIERYLPHEYFNDPQYYIRGADQNRTPVHFIFYSYLLLPSRIILAILGIDPLLSFPITNLVILGVFLAFIMKRYIKIPKIGFILLLLIYLSPIVSFITWPGPDIYYISLILFAVFAFFHEEYLTSAILSALASWHSQPLAVIAIGFILFNIRDSAMKSKINNKSIIPIITEKILLPATLLGLIIIFPYIYNYLQFGVWTPWTIIQNGWTQINGFGLQNIILQKFLDQFVDYNTGIFWYAPFIFVIGIYEFYRNRKNNNLIIISLIFLVTSLFYETNPAWHYGTAGFGPSRHIMFILPLLLFYTLNGIINIRKTYLLIFAVVVLGSIQLFSLYFNGFINPDFRNALKHNPYAGYILKNYPSLYNPTPEIFVDRTNRTDLDHPTSAFYKIDDYCRKAFVLASNIEMLKVECGFIPLEIRNTLLTEMKSLKPYEGIYVNY